MENGFPTLTDSFLAGQDILYAQFNDVEFYVEDESQEHFYFNILKKIFPDIKFEKIFPLNGKKNVKDAARVTIGNKKKIYIVDLDFDEILGIKENLDNLFYLKKYSIENHLIEKNAIFEIIREKDSKLKNHEIEAKFNYKKLLSASCHCLAELASSFYLIQKYSLGESYFGLNPARDFDFTTAKPAYRNTFITQYFTEVEAALKVIDNRFTLNAQIKKVKKNFNTLEKALANVPGKYLLNVIKNRLENLSLISNVSLESFTYKLSKEVDTNELEYLKIRITKYMK